VTQHRFRNIFSAPLGCLLGLQGLVIVAFSIFGKMEICPEWIHSSGYFFLTSDSFSNHDHAIELAKLLHQWDFGGWWETWSRFHTRIASLFYASLGPFLGEGILAIWPMNASLLFLSYKGWTALVEKLGGDSSKGAWSLLFIPTLILHYTQLLRDPFYISFLMLWVLGWVEIFVNEKGYRLLKGMTLVLIITPLLFWSRERFWALAQVIALVFLFIASVCLIMKGKSFVRTFLLLFMLTLLVNGGSLFKMTVKWLNLPILMTEVTEKEIDRDGRLFFFYKIALLRDNFLRSYPSESSLNPEMRFTSDAQVVQNIPQSLLTGLLAPFPFHWWTVSGKSGVFKWLTFPEMLGFLIIFSLLVMNWLKRPPSLSEILLLSVVLCSVLALGLVVTNLGALYRMRLASWCLILALWAARTYGREEVSS
jgi:hypothetical protein